MSCSVPAPDTGPDAGAVWHHGDPFAEQRLVMSRAMRPSSTAATAGSIAVSGPDRLEMAALLLLTQHVSALPDGGATEALVLDGQGRVATTWVATEVGDVVYLDVEAGRVRGAAVVPPKMVFWSDAAVDGRAGVALPRRPPGPEATVPPRWACLSLP